jgi:hypothetical protein
VKNTSLSVSSVCLTALLLPSAASALNIRGVEVGFQPRVEAGVLYYEYVQDAVTGTLPVTSQQVGANFVQEKVSLKDTMPIGSAGLTVFANRFFLDFSGLTTLSEGEDGDQINTSIFTEGFVPITDANATFGTTRESLNADFDRDEYAISLGFSVTDQLAVFAGYKWAKTDFKTKSRGTSGFLFFPDIDPIPDLFDPFPDRTRVEADFSSEQDFELEYDGPFVGVNYGLEVNAGFLEGTLSFNFAAAFLDGDTKSDFKGQTLTINTIDGIPIDGFNPINLDPTRIESQGETLGLTFGIGWRGFTPIENLTYAVNLSGYKYEFDGDNSDVQTENPNFEESALTFRVGLAYAF